MGIERIKSSAIGKITDHVFELNKGTSIVTRDTLKDSISNEIDIIINLLKLLRFKFNKKEIDKTLEAIIPNENYVFIKDDIELVDSNIKDIKINNGFDLLKSYESMQKIKDKKIFGQYYTPDVITDKMLEEIDIKNYYDNSLKILDPACGVGAFLLKLIDKAVKELVDYESIKKFLNNCIYGNDINTNSIFMTRLCLLLQLYNYFPQKNICEDFKVLLDNVKNVNTLFYEENIEFDLIIGNPPYFKTKINKEISDKYGCIISGQPNVYALFLFWALNNVRDEGIVTFVIPQSIMNGKYFYNIRNYLSKFSIISINFINEKTRKRLFLGAEQAVLILNLKKSKEKKGVVIKYSNLGEKENILKIDNQEDVFNEKFIIFPKTKQEQLLIKKLTLKSRIKDVFNPLKFGNGLFVWNQQKNNLTAEKTGANPIIYGNYITREGFDFNTIKNNRQKDSERKAFCYVTSRNQHFQFSSQTLLVKRTSSLNKFNRISCCIIDDKFVKDYKTFFIENHINMLYNSNCKYDSIDPMVLYFLESYLKSNVANFYISKTNGNTQVSAMELNDLPMALNNIEDIRHIDKFKSDEDLQNYFYNLFKLTKKEINIIEREKHDKC